MLSVESMDTIQGIAPKVINTSLKIASMFFSVNVLKVTIHVRDLVILTLRFVGVLFEISTGSDGDKS